MYNDSALPNEEQINKLSYEYSKGNTVHTLSDDNNINYSNIANCIKRLACRTARKQIRQILQNAYNDFTTLFGTPTDNICQIAKGTFKSQLSNIILQMLQLLQNDLQSNKGNADKIISIINNLIKINTI